MNSNHRAQEPGQNNQSSKAIQPMSSGAIQKQESLSLAPIPSRSLTPPQAFDQPIILRQSPIWSRIIVWLLVASTSFVIIWAAVFQIDEAVSAQGKLEPTGAVKKIQVPANGVIKSVYVKDGQQVKKGQPLLKLDPRNAEADMTANTAIRDALAQENQLYRAQLQGSRPAPNLSLDKQALLLASQAEANSRLAGVQSEIQQSERQLSQNNFALASAQDVLALNQNILDDLKSVADEGGIPKLQYRRQEQEVRQRQAEVDRLQEEQKRLNATITQAQQRLQNTTALNRKELLTKIADNDKKLAELEGQLKRGRVAMQYEVLKAPVSGKIFDFQSNTPGAVVSTSEPILKIVPDKNLVAKVFITNRDIGFIQEGMDVDVRIDSFPFSEYGDVKGKVVQIGSDALPPDQIYNFYRFPVEIRLDQQDLLINKQPITLQSGMSLSANIRTRKRTILSIFTELFTRQVESVRYVR
jgi:hemolysin D